MLRHLLSQSCQLLQPKTAANGFGTTADDWTDPERKTHRCRLQLASGAENTDGRDLSVGQWKLTLPPEAVVTEHMRAVVDGKTFEVVSVYPAHTPRGLHHYEVTLTTFSGGVPSG